MQEADIYRNHGLIKMAESRQAQTVLKYVSDFEIKDARLAGWPGGAKRDQARGGMRRSGHLVPLPPAPQQCSCHLIHGSSRFARRTVKSSVRNGIYVPNDPVGHVGFPRGFYKSSRNTAPTMVGREEYGSLSARFFEKGMVAGKYSVGNFSVIRNLVSGDLFQMFSETRPDNPAEGSTKRKSAMAPLVTTLGRGTYCPNRQRP